MIIKVHQSTVEEIEITFPSYYKIAEQYSKPKYYAFFNERLGLFLCDGFTYQTTPSSCDFKIAIPCDREEVAEVFIANQRLFNNTFNQITIDLNSNTPTEELENLNTILFGHDEG